MAVGLAGGESRIGLQQGLAVGTGVAAEEADNARGGRCLFGGVELLLLQQRITHGAEHEFYHGAGVCPRRTLGKGGVVFLLPRVDDGFHRQVFKQGTPMGENNRLPQAPDATVAVGKGVDEFKLVMEHGACHQGGHTRLLKPRQ